MKGSPVHPRHANCRGSSSVKTIVALPAIIAFAWLAAEMGLVLRAFNDAKVAADAISLAAAARYRDGFYPAAGSAVSAAVINRAPSGPVQISIGSAPNGAGGDVEFGRWDSEVRSFTPDSEGGPAVRATVRFAADHPNGVPGFVLPGIFTPEVFAIERSSVAVYNPPKHITSALVTGGSAPTISMSGSGRIVTRGGLGVSCDGDFAVSLMGTSSIETAVVRIEGVLDSNSESAIDGPVEQVPAVADDPFAARSLPSIDPTLAGDIQHGNAGTTLVSPGVHAGLTATGGTIVLQPGLHQFVGGISLSGNASLTLQSATIQLADGAGIELLGRATIAGTPSNALGDWSRHAIIQRSTATWTVGETASVELYGDLYAPLTALILGGESQASVLAMIVGSIAVTDESSVLVDGSVDELETAVVPGRARLVR